MCENAVDFLDKYVVSVLNGNDDFPKSYDLWEEYEGVSLYSLAAIFGAYGAMLEMYKEVTNEFSNNRLKIEAIEKRKKVLEKRQREIKDFVLHHFYDEGKKSFVRNLNDGRIDISILGAVYPFKLFTSKEKRVLTTFSHQLPPFSSCWKKIAHLTSAYLYNLVATETNIA